MIEIDVSRSPKEWHSTLFGKADKNDFVIFYDDDDSYIWFTTQYTQFLIGIGGFEVAPIYGRMVKSLKSFLYQVNLCLPVGYRVQAISHALYDLLLNFETEPEARIIIWNDADYLFKKNKKAFVEIFDSMIVASYGNRLGRTTIKEDGTPYKVDQRNIFFFKSENKAEVMDILNTEYYQPYEEIYKKIEFNIVTLKSISDK
ncbi:MAG: hypothetical protein F9K23_03565 [Bacteroidetes bacterium]|nr:MAG: hypothetical protein F9K23_03565 [Bacteroidota bacterium]